MDHDRPKGRLGLDTEGRGGLVMKLGLGIGPGAGLGSELVIGN